MTIPSEISYIIKSSGNSFHTKVARWLTAHGWHVVVSPYYMDQSQGKAREIDLIAEKVWKTTGQLNRDANDVLIRLFVECKYIASHAVFWFAKKDIEAAKNLVSKGGLFKKDNTYSHAHHYLSQSERVAKLFQSESSSKVAENEPIYKALNQVLSAMVSMISIPISVPSQKDLSGYTTVIQYPLVVFNSFEKVYRLDFDAESEPEPVQDNFQLEVRYAYLNRTGNQQSDYFLLDFVDFNQLANFEKAIDADAKAAQFFISQRS